MAKRVVITDHVFGGLDIERETLEPLGAEVVLAASSDEDTLVDLASTADAMLVCFAAVGAPVVRAAGENGCAVIARYGIGVDNIDIPTATELGIRVTNVPDYCLDEVADHTLALLLCAARQLVPANLGVREGDWTIPHGNVHRLRGRRLALLGVGRIGSRVVERALPLGLEVVGYDPFLTEPIPGLIQVGSAAEAVREADFVSLHAPLTDETHHLIGPELIAEMERAPVVINTSRGPLVDPDAVVAALAAGTLSGVALDVTEVEPLPDEHPLRTHPQAVVTPHMAFYSVEAERELQERAADEVARALRGEPARSPVNDV
ncbi:MAG TPA: C-terminal binding protein [Solirubrobacterales bacterium]|nr:C-terminal binding protein [Solirubrobacterales bacterium]